MEVKEYEVLCAVSHVSLDVIDLCPSVSDLEVRSLGDRVYI